LILGKERGASEVIRYSTSVEGKGYNAIADILKTPAGRRFDVFQGE
jgi:hypothetical protein